MKNARNDLAYAMHQYFGFRFKFYKEGQYWCYDIIEVPNSFEQYSFTTTSRRLAHRDHDSWVTLILSSLDKAPTRHLLAKIREHHARMWAEKPTLASVYNIPKPEECATTTPTAKPAAPAEPTLNRYRFEVVERFQIFVDAQDEDAAKAFIEEGVPQMQHAGLKCHARSYHLRSCKPIDDCENPRDGKKGDRLRRLEYYCSKVKEAEFDLERAFWERLKVDYAKKFKAYYDFLPTWYC